MRRCCSMAKQSSLQLTNQLDTNAEHISLRVLESDQRQLWDAFVAADPHGHILQSWGWGDLKAAFGWRPLRVALWDKEQQQIVAGVQILFRSLPFTPLSIAYAPKGPVLN